MPRRERNSGPRIPVLSNRCLELNSSSAIAYHDALAAQWDQRYLRGGFRRRAKFFHQDILPQLPVSGTSWLDAGCGTGFFSRVLARHGAEVIGVDGSREMITAGIAQAEQEELAQRLQLRVVSGLGQFDFSDFSFDGCLCLSVIEYLDEPERSIAEIVRLLRPGGVFVASFPNSRSVLRRIQGLLRNKNPCIASYLATSRNSWTRKELEEMLKARGLHMVMSKGFDPFLPTSLHGLFPPSLHFVIARKSPFENSLNGRCA